MTPDQKNALMQLCNRYGVTFVESDYGPTFDLPDGYVAGWVGGLMHEGLPTIYVGVSPEGDVSS